LYGREEIADASNNLRVTVHRLKKLLVTAGLPEYDYIVIKKGIYRWNSPMPVVIDSEVFLEKIHQAEEEAEEAKKIKILKEACRNYGGEFLPSLSGEDWVLIASLRYKNLYAEAMQYVLDYLMKCEEYEEALQFCAPACEMYPFDEWQTVRIECYIAMNRYKEAMKEYDDTAKMFFEELGIKPSERMMQLFESMSGSMRNKPQAILEIKSKLKEDTEESGAYYCNFPSFRDNFRLIRRIIERSGQSVFLMQCDITDGKGLPMEPGEKLDTMSQELYDAIKHCLRRGDSFTQYSPSQFLLLLIGTNRENCKIIFDRIEKYYTREHHSWGKYLEYYAISIADVEEKESMIRFDSKESNW
jgi:DNA-binding SARP family transcriptional activator/GGDEF domain-containing protein